MIQGHGDDAYRFGRPIRANFSSNVYGHVDLAPLKAHLRERLDAIGNYPEPEPYTLEKALADRLGLDSAAVCVTSGATEAIYLTAHAFAGSQTAILQPTFSEYADACSLYNHHLIPHARQNLFRPGTSPVLKEPAAPPGPRAICWLCNPNNPTGEVIPKDELVKTIEAHPETVFVIDQSYGFFTEEPLLGAAEAVALPNVVQLHSMTKRFAMPGLRLGYITANPQLLDRIHAVRMPWSVNALAIEAGLYLTEHPDTAPVDRAALLREAERLRGEELHLLFEGVESGFACWLNGVYIGYSEDSFDPADFALSGALREGKNKLALRVFKWTPGSWFEDQDFYRFSGIFRAVFRSDSRAAFLKTRQRPACGRFGEGTGRRI